MREGAYDFIQKPIDLEHLRHPVCPISSESGSMRSFQSGMFTSIHVIRFRTLAARLLRIISYTFQVQDQCNFVQRLLPL